MTIYWDVLLDTKDIKAELQRLYDEMPLNALADYLGVARDTVRKQLRLLNIKIRPRGGAHYRYPRNQLPDNVAIMPPQQLASITGYTVNYCRKLLRQWRKKERKKEKFQLRKKRKKGEDATRKNI